MSPKIRKRLSQKPKLSSGSKSQTQNKPSPISTSTPNLKVAIPQPSSCRSGCSTSGQAHRTLPTATPTPTRKPTPPRPITLACPFYKLNPAAHQSCARLKLSKISYVKQHLVRHHMVPTHCPRCLKVFSEFNDFHAHLRQEERCEERSGNVEGITETMKKQLSRRSDHSVGEAEQWRDIWKIIFGQRLRVSPYIDLDLPEEINWYNDYLFSEIPERLSRKDVPQTLVERRALVLGTVEEVARDWKSLWQQERVTAIK
ncbi:hypothetical protein NUW58_g7462 [Xylaria curta]|uniref:Uncharacterized protein n=1 Tax=Xylaria curta TaxID=42375 RepID=A0ACC1NHK5_9PEZI|nr:hypothetical protein NUW58_g7462 [Xylaria curta]